MIHPRRLTPDAIHQMTLTTEPWLSCDDCFGDLDAGRGGSPRADRCHE